MSSQKTKGFHWYDSFYFGITRGYLREATNRPDLAEGVRWLSLARCRGFPTIEGAWQRIRRSGRQPTFERRKCPLCSRPVDTGWEWSHLLVDCTHDTVVNRRFEHIQERINVLGDQMGGRNAAYFEAYMDKVGRETQTGRDLRGAKAGVLSIYLIGGCFRPLAMRDDEGWFHAYTIGFGHSRLVTAGLEGFGYVFVAQFLQAVSPLFVAALGGDLYGDRSLDGSQRASSPTSSVNLEHIWLTDRQESVDSVQREEL
jgi:hypothetical protein